MGSQPSKGKECLSKIGRVSSQLRLKRALHKPKVFRTESAQGVCVSYTAAITGTGVFTPEQIITNAELVEAFNAYADKFNAENAEAIAAGEVVAKDHSSEEFIVKASGIEQRYVMDKEGVLDPDTMHPRLRQRGDDEPSIMAEMAVDAAKKALAQAGRDASEIDAVICAASNMERAYPAVAIEIQQLLGISGFAFDMNVACSSATFGLQAAADMLRSGSIRSAIVVNPEICSGHLEWRDRDCHFIFGDVATAVVLERVEDAKAGYFEIKSTRCATEFSNNIRNNNGFLRRSRPAGVVDRRDMQFMQNGRKVFKEVVPMVSQHITDHLSDIGVTSDNLKRLWLHQANKSMNDFIGRKVLGREPEAGEQPNILQDYANTSSAGSIIAFSKYSSDMTDGDMGLICSFGAGYSVGSVIVERHD
ncbi:MAG: beta-ketoacyl-ACP synthase III [Rhodobacteraceae bacterium]|nr:beta-ketoacyl-ACP synthase III [Paracoccaceae bacterium]